VVVLGFVAGALAGTAGALADERPGADVPLADYGPAPQVAPDASEPTPDEPAPRAAAEARARMTELDRQWPRFGIMLDAGLPDGMTGSFVYRPWYWLRLHLGAGYNFVGPGVRGGLSMVPFRTWISPSASIEGGHYFQGDANRPVSWLVGAPGIDNALLKSLGYSYVNLHAGLELGSRRFTFYVHAGWSYVDLSLHPSDANGMSFAQAPRAHVSTLSGRVGFVLYVL
jgi:hypothetical protein